MAVCKCKMCGGDLNITELDKVVECDYCGTSQTVPSADSEKKLGLFNRANRLRLNSEFDKAAGIYESIISEFPEEAEAYWCLLLCKYGIEYVDDPATGKKIPTCHRSSFDSVMEDENFEQACEYTDAVARRVYRDEAKRIEEIRKGIIEVSSKEEPYDIFICYKETDDNGDRTVDSAIAQDVYTALTEKGYRVFFSRISLEDKLGQEYEPYIFAALHSAKIMLAFGTDYEYYNAVWVKNEWSRFLQLIAAGQKKTLIPCFKDIDAYDMPKEFAKLQAQDMGKVGAIQDLLRGIEKILPKSAPAQTAAANPASATVGSLLDRAFLFLEDGKWQSADEYAEKVLDIDPRCGEAYLAKAMSDMKIRERKNLADDLKWQENPYIEKTLRFGSEALKAELSGYAEAFAEAEKARKIAEEERKKAEAAAAEKARNEAFAAVVLRRKEIAPVQGLLYADLDYTVALNQDGTVEVAGSDEYGLCGVAGICDVVAFAKSVSHSVFLKTDGTVAAIGQNHAGQCNVSDWQDIVAVAAGYCFTAGLKKDGTVLCVGENAVGRINVSQWHDIVKIASNENYIIGVKKDGTAVIAMSDENRETVIEGWKDIVSVAVCENMAAGLKKDGTVEFVDTTTFTNHKYWSESNIVAVAARGFHVVGLTEDGRVLFAGDSSYGMGNVEGWEQIVAVSTGWFHSVGLKPDGTVVAVGNNQDGQCDVESWRDIVAVAAGDRTTAGLKADGTVVAVGMNDVSQCEVSNWKLFDDYRTFEQGRPEAMRRGREKAVAAAKKAEEERIAAAKKAEEERIAAAKKAEEERRRARQAKFTALTKEKAALEAELPTLKGLFKGGRRKEVEARLAAIETELKNLQ